MRAALGKYIKVGLHKRYRVIIGANTRTYLLEKFQVVVQAEEEKTVIPFVSFVPQQS